jgi:ribonuclease Z
MLDVALIGTGGMAPLPGRYLTAFLTRLNGRLLLIDCGEGSQVTLKILGWGFKNIDIILITHFHADHISGFPGLALMLGNSGRREPLTVVGPPGIARVVKSLLVIAPELPYSIEFIELNNDFCNIKLGDYTVSALPVFHRIPCFGYKIEVPRQRKFDIQKASKLDLPRQFYSKLQNGQTVNYNGNIYTPDAVLGEERVGIKVCYITDTRPLETMIDFIRGSDLYVGEGIYGDDEKRNKACEYRHTLFSESAEIAKRAKVKKLWLTHFSPSLTEPEKYIDVAKNIFPNTEIGKDRKTETIFFSD